MVSTVLLVIHLMIAAALVGGTLVRGDESLGSISGARRIAGHWGVA